MTIQTEDLREKVARIIRNKVHGATYMAPLSNGMLAEFPALGVVGADEAADAILALISSTKGGGDQENLCGSGAQGRPSRGLGEPGATPSEDR